MLKSELLEIISNGENSGVEFKRDDVRQRSPRNPMIMDILRGYGYVDSRGMGVRKKVIPLMREANGTEPSFEATDDYLKTTLYKEPKPDA